MSIGNFRKVNKSMETLTVRGRSHLYSRGDIGKSSLNQASHP